MPVKSNVTDKELIRLLNLVNGGSLCFLSPQDKAITGGDIFIGENKMREPMQGEKDLWLFTTDDGTINSLMVRPWNNLEAHLENTLEEIYRLYPTMKEGGGWFFMGDLLQ